MRSGLALALLVAPLTFASYAQENSQKQSRDKGRHHRCIKFFGTFLDFCCFRKFRYFIKLHLHNAARSTKI